MIHTGVFEFVQMCTYIYNYIIIYIYVYMQQEQYMPKRTGGICVI